MQKPPLSKTVCVIPWLHLNIVPNGKVLHCCMTSDMSHTVGDLNEQSLEEIWNSENLRAIRAAMLKGEQPGVCSKCYAQEASSGFSQRLYLNKYFLPKLFEIARITEPSGHVDKVDLKYWDFRFSNLCNYRCRSCGPDSSSAWVPDAKKLGWLNDQEARKYLHVESVGEAPNLDFIQRYLHQVERIYFAGGEPLLMEEHWQILELLDSQQRYDVQIVYNTNLGTLEYKGRNAADYWRKWGPNVTVRPSLDELGERAELIRSGTVWRTVVENLGIIAGLGAGISPNITVSVFNVSRLPDIIDGLAELGAIAGGPGKFANFSLNVVEQPHYYHVSVLPLARRQDIRQRLEGYIESYNRRHGADIGRHFLHLFSHLDAPSNPKSLEKFRAVTAQLDALRGEQTRVVIPELADILEPSP